MFVFPSPLFQCSMLLNNYSAQVHTPYIIITIVLETCCECACIFNIYFALCSAFIKVQMQIAPRSKHPDNKRNASFPLSFHQNRWKNFMFVRSFALCLSIFLRFSSDCFMCTFATNYTRCDYYQIKENEIHFECMKCCCSCGEVNCNDSIVSIL